MINKNSVVGLYYEKVSDTKIEFVKKGYMFSSYISKRMLAFYNVKSNSCSSHTK